MKEYRLEYVFGNEIILAKFNNGEMVMPGDYTPKVHATSNRHGLKSGKKRGNKGKMFILILTEEKGLTSLKSLRLQKLLDAWLAVMYCTVLYCTVLYWPYWALLGLAGSYWALLGALLHLLTD